MTTTNARLEVPYEIIDYLSRRLIAAGYTDCFVAPGMIDMNGIVIFGSQDEEMRPVLTPPEEDKQLSLLDQMRCEEMKGREVPINP